MKKKCTHKSLSVVRCFCKKNLAVYLLISLFTSHLSAQTLNNINTLQSAKSKATVNEVSKIISSAGVKKSAPGVSPAVEQKTELDSWKEAAKFAKNNTQDFVELLDFYSKYMQTDDLFKHFNTASTKNIYYASLAMQKSSVLEQYFTNFSFDPVGNERKMVEEEIATIKSVILKSANPTVSFFATGNIRSVATSKSTEPLTAGTGTIGVTYSSDHNIFSAQVAVASTQDTTKSGFGANVLSPLNGKALKSGLLEWYPQVTKNPNVWLHFYGSFSSSTWDMDTSGDASLAKSSSVIGLGALYHQRLFGGQLAETEVGLDAEIGISGRFLGGDVRNLLNSEAGKAKYLEAFPSSRSSFVGLEGGFTLNFGQLVGAVQAYYLLPKRGEPIEGLSKLQISVGLSVRGDIIKGILK